MRETTTIDTAGRLVLPKALREKAGIVPGMRLEIRWRDGRIEIEPPPRAIRIERWGRVLVAEPLEPGDELSRETVRATIEELRRGNASR